MLDQMASLIVTVATLKKTELVVSRVLFRRRTRGDDHLSRHVIANALKQPTRKSNATNNHGATANRHLAFCLALLRMGFTKPLQSPAMLVGSYPTFSPLPYCRHRSDDTKAVYSLLHFP